MSNLKILYKILRLKGMKISDFWFKNRNNALHLAVKSYQNTCGCPQCGRHARVVHQTSLFGCLEILSLSGMKVLFRYAPKEIECPTHGRMQETTMGSEILAHHLPPGVASVHPVPDLSQDAAAGILQMASSALIDLLHRIITHVRQTHKTRGLVTPAEHMASTR